ncbi:hypothetical protein GCM10007052_32270 [Halioglobus japonicus]|nr:hypothetical protein GCM10007052_32270 [Halioglobus japonicus]
MSVQYVHIQLITQRRYIPGTSEQIPLMSGGKPDHWNSSFFEHYLQFVGRPHNCYCEAVPAFGKFRQNSYQKAFSTSNAQRVDDMKYPHQSSRLMS